MVDYAESKFDEAWVNLQQKTFTRWTNVHLGERLLKVEDLLVDLGSGVLLCNLLEIISDKKIKFNKKVRNNFHRAENLNAALKFMKDEGLVLVNTGSDDITAGNKRIILGMIWTIILRYQIQKGDGKKSPKQELLEWVNKQIEPYGLPKCKNFTNDFQNGRVLNALCDVLENGCINMDQVMANTPMKNNAQALNTADGKFDIPAILDPIDIVNVPDDHSMMTYVSYFRAYEANRAKDSVPHANACYADGPGVEGGKAGAGPLPFTIHTQNRKNRPIQTEAKYEVEAFSPDGTVLPVTLVDNGDGTVSGEYTPVTSGDHRVVVKLGKANIRGSVYKPYVKPSADPNQSWAEGPGLESARDDEPGVFTVFARDSDGNPVTGANPVVEITTSNGDKVLGEVVDNNNGSFGVTYAPLPAGLSTIAVKLDDTDIKDTPVQVDVTKGIHSESTYVDGPGVAPSVFIGRPNPFTIHALDDQQNPLTKGGDSFDIKFLGPNGAIKVDQTDNGDGNYPCSYTAPESAVGPAVLNVINQRDSKAIKDTPIDIVLKLPADHSKSYAEGPGLEKAFEDKPNLFTIYALDKNNQPVSGEDVKVLLAYGDAKGAGKPASRASAGNNEPEFIQATVTEVAKFCAECGEGGQKAKFCWSCGAKTKAKTVTKQIPNPKYNGGGASSSAPRAAGGLEYTDEGAVVDNGDGTYSATYQPKAGEKYVTVNVHIYGQEIKGVPVSLKILKGASAATSTAEGPGVTAGFVNRPNRFKIQAKDEDGNPINHGGDDFSAVVTGPDGNDVPCKLQDNGNGTYSAQYTPTVEGPHVVKVNLGDQGLIKDMPKTCHVLKGASAKNSYMKGKGIRWGYEGKKNTFTVYAFDEDGNPVSGEELQLLIVLANEYDDNKLENKFIVDKSTSEYQDYNAFNEHPEGSEVDRADLNAQAVVVPSVTDNGNGTYTVVYQPKITGDYVIDCRLYDEHIIKSPARLTVYFNCPHQECQDAMAVLHEELLSYEEPEGKAAQEPTENEIASLKTIIAGKHNLARDLVEEQKARQAADAEVARLRALLAKYE